MIKFTKENFTMWGKPILKFKKRDLIDIAVLLANQNTIAKEIMQHDKNFLKNLRVHTEEIKKMIPKQLTCENCGHKNKVTS